MSDQSTNLSLPYILPAQAQKHVTHNEALRLLDVIVQLSVLARDLTLPPTTAVQGDRYIVPMGAQGDWAQNQGHIALFQDGLWQFFAPNIGWTAWVAAESVLASYDGATWVAAADMAQTFGQLGISATADAINRLVVSSSATLFNHDGAGHQLKINKAMVGDTASLLFQTGFSGRAEMGTAGNDDFAIKVSADGNAFLTGLSIAGQTGQVTLPAALRLGGQSMDPIAPQDGTIWLNSTTGQVKMRSNGVDVILASVAGLVNAQLADMESATIKGRAASGTGAPQDLTPDTVAALLPTVTATTKGLAPASGGGAVNFLRADGVWAAPTGGSGNLSGLGITATAAQINPLAAIATNHFLVADTSANLALGADDFANGTYWSQNPSTSNGLTTTVYARGVTDTGVPWIEYAISGTAIATQYYSRGYVGPPSRTPAAIGEQFTGSAIVQRTLSSGIIGFRLAAIQETAPGTFIRQNFVDFGSTVTTTISTTTTIAAPANQVLISTGFMVQAGAVLNDRFRIYGLQLDRGNARVTYTHKAVSPAAARVAMGVDPAGQVSMFAMQTAPAGWLKANGALVSRTTYAALFAAIGTTYGPGDGTTTFALPDLRGEFLRGWDDGRGADSGRTFGSAQEAAMLNHTHSGTTSTNGSHTHGIQRDISSGFLANSIRGDQGISNFNPFQTDAAGSHNHTITTGNPSVGGGAETRPRNVALLACIKF